MVLYYCGFDSFLKFKHKQTKTNVFLKPLSDLILDNQDKVINAFIGWCSLFLQTGNGQVVYLGNPMAKASKGQQQDLIICSKAPKYIINIECGSKETYLLTLDQMLFKWTGIQLADQVPQPIKLELNDIQDNDNQETGDCQVKIEQISVGVEYSAILTDSRSAYSIKSLPAGKNEFKKLTDKKIISISCGQEHILMLSERGRVLSYGTGTRGQLGHGDLVNVNDSGELVDALDGLQVKSIAAGGWHSMALTSQGDVYVWGWNESGQLGFPKETITMKALPIPLEISDDDHFIAISAGSRHSMALSENGILFGWGWNKWGQLGLDLTVQVTDTPQVIPVDEKVKSICCKFWSSLIETERESSPEDNEEN